MRKEVGGGEKDQLWLTLIALCSVINTSFTKEDVEEALNLGDTPVQPLPNILGNLQRVT